MVRKHVWIGIMLAVMLLGSLSLLSLAAPAPSRPAQGGEYLLKYPGFVVI